MSETRDDETRNAGLDTCPTCGSRVRIVGTTTMHYEPADDAPSLTPPAPPPEGAAGQDKTRLWHQHLDGCAQCRERPFDPCRVGAKILTSP